MVFLRIFSLVLTAIILVPSAAHLFELPGKIGLGEKAYFSVQGIYAGWSHFAIPIFAAILLDVALAVVERKRDPAAARWALASAGFVALSLVTFFLFVLPGNQATANWTTPTHDWMLLRTHWEYGHAAGAILVFLAFLSICMATVRRGRD